MVDIIGYVKIDSKTDFKKLERLILNVLREV